jgi:hypothetical protein
MNHDGTTITTKETHVAHRKDVVVSFVSLWFHFDSLRTPRLCASLSKQFQRSPRFQQRLLHSLSGVKIWE